MQNDILTKKEMIKRQANKDYNIIQNLLNRQHTSKKQLKLIPTKTKDQFPFSKPLQTPQISTTPNLVRKEIHHNSKVVLGLEVSNSFNNESFQRTPHMQLPYKPKQKLTPHQTKMQSIQNRSTTVPKRNYSLPQIKKSRNLNMNMQVKSM